MGQAYPPRLGLQPWPPALVFTVSRVLACLVLVVIFSRRGLVPAGSGVGVPGTLFRLAPRCSVWLPLACREEVATPDAPLLIFERCRVRAEPAFVCKASSVRRRCS